MPPRARSYAVRRAAPAETQLLGDLRLASLLALEMPGASLEAVATVMTAVPDVDAEVVAAGQYFVAEADGELIGGAGWSVLPLGFRSGRLLDAELRPAALSLAPAAVLVRGLFVDPDFAGRAVGTGLMAHVEAEAGRAGHDTAELLAPASAELLYRRLGFRPVRRLLLAAAPAGRVPVIQMSKRLPQRLRKAA